MKKRYQLLISLALTLLIGFIIYRSVPNWDEAWSVMIQMGSGGKMGSGGQVSTYDKILIR